tara:strand:+ start:1268 stop:2470 length:1203 start_codon:yes stop_codon:yes gene_type:complete
MANTKIPAELSSTPSISDSGNATAITIDSSERVLIGTDSGDSFNADSMLRLQRTGDRVFQQFKTDADQNSGILFGDVDDDVECAIEYEPANKALTFSTGNNTEAIRINESGTIGIGTSSPTSYANSQKTLVIEDTTSPAIAWSDTGQTRDWFAIAQGSGLYFNYGDGGGSGSASNVTSVLVLDNGGNVGIGTDSPATQAGFGTPLLEVRGSSGGTLLSTNSTTGGEAVFSNFSTGLHIAMAGAATASTGNQILFRTGNTNSNYNSTIRMTITSGGNIGAPSGTNIYNASDARLKQNINSLSDSLNIINNLNPVSFNWVDNFEDSEKNKTLYGFVAQEVQDVFPDAVEDFSGGEDIELNGETIENPLAVREKFIVPLLVKAIQEQQTIIENLKARIETLEG